MFSGTWHIGSGMHLLRQAERNALAVPPARARRNGLVSAKALGHLPFKVERKKSPVRRSAKSFERRASDLVKDLQALPFAVPTMRTVAADRLVKAVSKGVRVRKVPSIRAQRKMRARKDAKDRNSSLKIAGFTIPTIAKFDNLSIRDRKKFLEDLRVLRRRKLKGLIRRVAPNGRTNKQMIPLFDRFEIYSLRSNGTVYVETSIRKRLSSEHRKAERFRQSATYSSQYFI